MPSYVIAGASLAGAKAAETLRDEEFDGEIVVRAGLRGMLAAEPGIEVAGEAASGPEGVAQARARGYDVILMDCGCPAATAWRRRSRSSRPGRPRCWPWPHGAGPAPRSAALFISEATVKTHLLRAFGKLGVSGRTAAVTTAIERGLLPPPGRDR